jgi:hypothetical protein
VVKKIAWAAQLKPDEVETKLADVTTERELSDAEYENREQVLEILGLKGEADVDVAEQTGEGESQGVGSSGEVTN